MLYLRSLLLTLILPGTVFVYIPYFIVRWGQLGVFLGRGVPQIVGAILIGIGVVMLLHSIGIFAWVGRGTLAPLDPPKRLVVRGFYRYMRNPMYVGGMMMLLGEALFFDSVILLAYALVWFALINVVVMGYEEPKLKDDFGESYDHYYRDVHRWVPGRPYHQIPSERG